MGFRTGAGRPVIVAGGALGAAYTLDLATLGEVWLTGTLTANVTITVTNLTAGCRFKLLLSQDGTGGRTLTLSDGVSSQVVPIPATALATGEVDCYSPDGSAIFVDLGGQQAASPLHIPYISGRYYTALCTAFSGSTVGGKAIPYFVTRQQAFDRIAAYCVAVGAGSVVRLGIFADSNGTPGAVLLDAGTVDTSSGTGVKELTVSITLPAGLVWLAAVPQGGSTPSMVQSSGGQLSFQPIGFTAPQNGAISCYGIGPAGAFAANPTATPTSGGIIVWLRAV